MTVSKTSIPDLCGELLASLKMPRIESENEELKKHVAELEAEVKRLSIKCTEQATTIDRLAKNPPELIKRVKDLELSEAVLKDNLGIARKVIGDLKSRYEPTPECHVCTAPVETGVTKCTLCRAAGL